MISVDHPNAAALFDHDVGCLRTFFAKRFDFASDSWPSFGGDVRSAHFAPVRAAEGEVVHDLSGGGNNREVEDSDEEEDEESSSSTESDEGDEESSAVPPEIVGKDLNNETSTESESEGVPDAPSPSAEDSQTRDSTNSPERQPSDNDDSGSDAPRVNIVSEERRIDREIRASGFVHPMANGDDDEESDEGDDGKRSDGEGTHNEFSVFVRCCILNGKKGVVMFCGYSVKPL